MTVEQYLHTSFDGPDPEYVDGEIVERHLGSLRHSKAQRRVMRFVETLSDRYSLHPFPGLTLKVSATRYRVPDMSVYFGRGPEEEIPSIPPDLVVEIVSEDDRYSQIRERLAELRDWGVRHIWLADPGTRTLSVYDGAGLHEVSSFELPEFGATLSSDEIFS
jgi:Uma2 family endonuclease